jgi:hypothetical protein
MLRFLITSPILCGFKLKDKKNTQQKRIELVTILLLYFDQKDNITIILFFFVSVDHVE